MCLKEMGKVESARVEHQALLKALMEGPGGGERAMYRVQSVFGLSFWRQWNLRHKKRATLAFIWQVHMAYLAMLEKSVRRDLEKLKMAQAKETSDARDADLVAEAEDILARIAAKRRT